MYISPILGKQIFEAGYTAPLKKAIERFYPNPKTVPESIQEMRNICPKD